MAGGGWLYAYACVLTKTLMSDSFHCEQVGQKFTVMISSVDEKRSNLVISEKKAWVRCKAVILGIEI
jgi:hypothetical protein